MYIIASCDDFGSGPALGAAWLRPTLEEARDLAVRIALEGLGEPGDDDEATVRAAVVDNDRYHDRNREWSICIAKPEDN
jgi:hypothetical protein